MHLIEHRRILNINQRGAFLLENKTCFECNKLILYFLYNSVHFLARRINYMLLQHILLALDISAPFRLWVCPHMLSIALVGLGRTLLARAVKKDHPKVSHPKWEISNLSEATLLFMPEIYSCVQASSYQLQKKKDFTFKTHL